MNKEQQQVAMLVAVLVIIVGTLAYFFRDKLLPKPEGGAASLPPAARLVIPKAADDQIFERDDYKALKRYGDVPVRSLPGGSPNPFITEQELLQQ